MVGPEERICKSGLRQDDPLAPLFILAAGFLCSVINLVNSKGYANALSKAGTSSAICSLQYADDIVLFCKEEIDKGGVWPNF